ncbi:MAG: phosphatidylserine/phosphatidylglycerophosphate/cardiolipin synthase family protein [Halobacteriaceae archaeon]
MRRLVAALLLVTSLTAATGGAATGPSGPTIVGVVPNPVADGDVGEFVAVRVPTDTDLSTLRVADGESVARGPNATASGVVYLSPTPNATPDTRPTYGLRGTLSLSNSGERVELRRNETVLDVTEYGDAPEAELWNGSWQPLGATNLRVTAVSDVRTTAFVLPDSAGIPRSVVRSADRRLFVAGYTFRSRRVTRALLAAESRGVDVRVLVEGDPVGGTDGVQPALLDRLASAGVNVTTMDGPRARYRYHHAKYAVADDRVLVTSENWGPSGTGGANRGWGATVRSPRLADRLAAVFRADSGWRDGVAWTANGTGRIPPADRASYPSRFDAVETTVSEVRLLAAPDNAGRAIRRLLRSADETLRVQQVRIAPDHGFLNETLAAARRGVSVRVLLSGQWYVYEENRRVVERLNRVADAEGLDLRARLAEPRSRYRAIHVKGVVVDGERALVGSVNWNDVAVTENREIAVIISDRAVAARFARVFVADWRGGAWRVPVGLVLVAVLCVLGTGLLLRRCVSFGVSEARPPAGRARSRRRPSSPRERREPPPASRERT